MKQPKRKHGEMFRECYVTLNRKTRTGQFVFGNMTGGLDYELCLTLATIFTWAAHELEPPDNFTKVASFKHWTH